MKVSRFTPSLMKHKDLEEIFVQRHKLAQNIVECIRDSAITPSKHHTLLIGPRGIGKTHLVSLVYYRIHEMDDLDDCLLIAWLREEEWGITSFLDLLLRIFRALQEEYGTPPCPPLAKGGGEVDSFLPPLIKGGLGGLNECVEALYQLSPDAAERSGAELLKEVIGDRTLLLLMENLDEIFAGLGDEGQKRLRAFLQENTCCTILATAQSLFNGVKLQTSPFYGFFRIHHLEDLTSEDATQLLANIARLQGDRELESFIQMPTGRDRIRAVHHLAGGSHRVYVIFSEFLTRESLDELVEAFMQTLDDLTPYYQARMSYLSPQQRKIIEFLCDRRHPVPVKEIAQRCFMTHQTASSQLKDLREKGYVTSEAIGRESYYELREPLMRFCLEVKKQRGEPIRLFVDFLRFWYTRTELEQLLQLTPPSAALEREYVLHALQAIQEDEDSCVAAYLRDIQAFVENDNFVDALQVAQKLLTIRGNAEDWRVLGAVWLFLERWDEALASCNKAIKLNSDDTLAWNIRSQALRLLGYHDEALNSWNKLIDLDPHNALGWYHRGLDLLNLERYDEALESYDKAIELDLNSVQVWSNGVLPSVEAWHNRGVALGNLERHDEAVASFDKAVELDPNYVQAWKNRGRTLALLGRYNEALASFDKALELNPDDAKAWNGRGGTLGFLGYYNEALVSFDNMIKLDPNNALGWTLKGWVLSYLRRHDEALASYDRAIAFGDQSSSVFFNRAEALLALNRCDEGSAALDEALSRFAHADEPDTGDTETIVRNLFNSTNDVAIWRSRITTLIALYDKHQVISAIGQGLVRSIPALMSEMVSDKAAQTWLEVWRELVSDRPEFQIPLRLLNTAVRYRETKGDKRVLLELPIEERELLKPLLESEKT